MSRLNYFDFDKDELADIELAIQEIEELIYLFTGLQEDYRIFIRERLAIERDAQENYGKWLKKLDLAREELNKTLKSNPVVIAELKRTRGVLIIVERILQKHKVKA